MKLFVIATGSAGAVLLVLGFGWVGPIGGGIASLCDLAGVMSALVFFCLLDGA